MRSGVAAVGVETSSRLKKNSDGDDGVSSFSRCRGRRDDDGDITSFCCDLCPHLPSYRLGIRTEASVPERRRCPSRLFRISF